VAGYVLPIGLAVAGAVLWLTAGASGRGDSEKLPPFQEHDRAEKAEVDRQREDTLDVDPWAAPDRRTD
jgi:hypothetical protein